MLTKRKGNNYIVKTECCGYEYTVNRKKTDKAVKDLIKALDGFDSAAQNIRADSDLYDLLFHEIIDDFDIDILGRLSSIRECLAEFQDTLKTDDDFIERDVIEKKYPTLESFGYLQHWSGGPYEKVIRDDEDVEIVEEILPEYMMRRIRTTHWERTSYGCSSTDIKYKKLRLSGKLKEAAQRAAK